MYQLYYPLPEVDYWVDANKSFNLNKLVYSLIPVVALDESYLNYMLRRIIEFWNLYSLKLSKQQSSESSVKHFFSHNNENLAW